MTRPRRWLVDKADEETWESLSGDPKYAPKLKALLHEVDEEIAAGKADPLDSSRL